jgi:beta-glucanase (GH16 family)
MNYLTTRCIAAIAVTLALAGCASSSGTPQSFASGSLLPPSMGQTFEQAPEEQVEVRSPDPPPEPQWELVWSDEFDYDGLPNPEKWSYDTGGHGWGNNELQYYTSGDNAIVRDGKLVIEARREQRGRNEYTSTRLVTREKGDWRYGRVEVRARIPAGRGTWPAIWMLPTDWEYGGWPASGEIDIMEHVGYEQGVVHGTVHTDRYNHMKGTQQGGSIYLSNVSEEFHTYAVEWYQDRIRFLVDDELYYRFSPGVYLLDPTFREWPFDRRFHLILNVAVGGNWGGAQGIDETVWPVAMEVEYVRVYQDTSRRPE